MKYTGTGGPFHSFHTLVCQIDLRSPNWAFFGFLIIKTTSNHPGNIEEEKKKKKPCWDNEKGSKCRMGLSVRQEDLGSLEVL